ncbi:hypothetical protein DMENIID0001_051080 [Sergentomyia squamirostris]
MPRRKKCVATDDEEEEDDSRDLENSNKHSKSPEDIKEKRVESKVDEENGNHKQSVCLQDKDQGHYSESDEEDKRKIRKSTRVQRKAKYSLKKLMISEKRKLQDSSSSGEEEFELVNIEEIIRDPPDENQSERIPKPCTVDEKHGKKEYKCSKCPKVYDRPSKLRKHFRKHTGDIRAKWYNCEQCTKQFSTALKLDKHVIRRHTNDPVDSSITGGIPVGDIKIKKEPEFYPEEQEMDIKLEAYDNYEVSEINLQPKTELIEYSPTRPDSTSSSESIPDERMHTADLEDDLEAKDNQEDEKPIKSETCEEKPQNKRKERQKPEINETAVREDDEEEDEEIPVKRKRGRPKLPPKSRVRKTKPKKEKKPKLSRMELWRLRQYKCEYCCRRYAAKENLERHMEFHMRREKRFPCDKCEESFNSFGALRFHMGKVHVDKNCKVCGQVMATLTDQHRHKTMHQNAESYKYECDICHKRFARITSLKLHKSKIHSGGDLKCLSCPETFTKPVYLIGHALEAHGDDKPFGCSICNYRSNRQYHVEIHYRSHSLDMQIHCDICGRFFTNNSNFNTHKRQHENANADIDYRTCKECGKVFARRTYLNKHMKIHTGDLPFTCGDCNKKFTTKGQLAAHMVSHSNIRPFQCDVCAKTFPRSGTLKIHMRFHTNERPYQCRICSKAFHSSTLRTTHEKTHTGDTRKYTCSYCSKVYVSHKFYKQHLKMHESNVMTYSCPTCGICFMKMSRLNRHILTHVKDTEQKPTTSAILNHSPHVLPIVAPQGIQIVEIQPMHQPLVATQMIHNQTISSHVLQNQMIPPASQIIQNVEQKENN